jgi:NAD(P)-dependent dehydrogenase (short-subunit alcohol dehydrogenase family)
MGDLCKDRIVIVTGAGRGIGRSEALAFANEGAKVVVSDLGVELDGSGGSKSVAESVVEEIRALGGEATSIAEDVGDTTAAKRIIDCAIDTYGGLDVVVNNAGILRDKMIFNMDESDFDAVIHVHLKGTWNLSHWAATATSARRTTPPPRPGSPRCRSPLLESSGATASPPTRSPLSHRLG